MLRNRQFESQFDPNVLITEQNIAITLIRSPEKEFGLFPPKHAMIVIESLKNNEYTVNITDLVNPYTRFKSLIEVVKSHWGHSNNDTRVRWLTLKNEKVVKFFKKSPTWPIAIVRADLMFNEIHDEVEGRREVPAFYLLGGKSLLSLLTNHERHGRQARNCIHWALDKLRLVGINLSQASFNLMTDSSNYINDKQLYQINPYGTKELCDFIKLGEIEAIRRFYPPQNPRVDLNKLGWGDVGSVEFQLRNYTPLMIACGYGHWDIAKMLIEEYRVDVGVETKKGLSPKVFDRYIFISYTALDSAEKNVFGLTRITKEKTGKQEVINLIKEKMQQQKIEPANLACSIKSTLEEIDSREQNSEFNSEALALLFDLMVGAENPKEVVTAICSDKSALSNWCFARFYEFNKDDKALEAYVAERRAKGGGIDLRQFHEKMRANYAAAEKFKRSNWGMKREF